MTLTDPSGAHPRYLCICQELTIVHLLLCLSSIIYLTPLQLGPFGPLAAKDSARCINPCIASRPRLCQIVSCLPKLAGSTALAHPMSKFSSMLRTLFSDLVVVVLILLNEGEHGSFYSRADLDLHLYFLY